MTKKEIREQFDNEIMWELKFAIDEIESETKFKWYIQECCQKIQGMLLVAEGLKIITHSEWDTCMRMINHLMYCYEWSGDTTVSYKYW